MRPSSLFLLLALVTVANAATITLPGVINPTNFDIITLNDSIPQRTISYNIQNLAGDDISLRLRYINLNVLNIIFGDTVTSGAFTIAVGDTTVISQSDITNNTFLETSANLSNFTFDDTLNIQLVLGETSDAIGIYEPWLSVTDSIVPATITNLAPYRVSGSIVGLIWNAPGDDSLSGAAQMYELRYSQDSVGTDTAGWWENAVQAAGLPDPGLAGTPDSCIVSGLRSSASYYFALVSYDELGNRSKLSNIAACTTGVSQFCLYYDGSDYAEIPFNPVLNTDTAITLEAWYYLESDFGGMQAAVIDKPAPTHDAPFYQYNLVPVVPPDSIPDFYSELSVNNAYNPFEIQTAGAVDTWEHVALTFDGHIKRLYMNGELIGEIPEEGVISSYNTDIKLGALGNLNSWFFKGYIDEISLWNRARSQEEIQESMNHPLRGDEPGLVSYWNFDEGEGQIIHDLTSNGVNGYLGDMPDSDLRDPTWVESTAPIDTNRVKTHDTPNPTPSKIEIGQNYPNPFNSSTQFSFKLPAATKVKLDIFDMLGRKVATLADGLFTAGEHRISWAGQSDYGRRLSSGVYFCRLKTDSFTGARKVMMLK
jgi:hypothetical protein